MRKATALVAAVLAAIVPAACGGDSEGDVTTTVQAAAEGPSEEQVASLERKLEKQKQKQQELEQEQEEQEQEEQEQEAAEAEAAEAPPELEPEPAPEPATPPDVVGLTLPKAESLLRSAGFKPDVSNNDTLLGIVDKANYTVCKQSPPRGNIVPILAQKYGC